MYNSIIYIYIIILWISAWAQNSLINGFKVFAACRWGFTSPCMWYFVVGWEVSVVLKDHGASLFMVSQFLDSLTFEILGEQLIQEHSVTFHKALILIQLRFCMACFLPSMHVRIVFIGYYHFIPCHYLLSSSHLRLCVVTWQVSIK